MKRLLILLCLLCALAASAKPTALVKVWCREAAGEWQYSEISMTWNLGFAPSRFWRVKATATEVQLLERETINGPETVRASNWWTGANQWEWKVTIE